jgi:hypothetical protein
MASDTVCPHCGQRLIDSGQADVCVHCGYVLNAPLAQPLAAPARAVTAKVTLGIALVLTLMALLLCGGVLAAIVMPAVVLARREAQRAQSTGHLKMLALALHNYHDQWNQFPPAVVKDSQGQPLYSGRVLLLPYLEQKDLYESWDLSQSWDSPRNLPLASKTVDYFRDPGADDNEPGETDYLFVSGPGTIFEDGRAIGIRDINDGTFNTLMMVEVRASGVNWAEPRDLDLSTFRTLPPGNRPGGNLIAWADGSVHMLPSSTPVTDIHAAATRDGGEPNNLAE